jgi:hypothetical protein
MLIELGRHLAEKLPQIQASSTIVEGRTRAEKEELTEARTTAMEWWRVCRGRSDPAAVSQRGAAALSTMVPDVGKRRR